MPFRIGMPELLIILVIMFLLFGGRLTKTAGELAKGIKIFQKNLKDDDEISKPVVITKAEEEKKAQ